MTLARASSYPVLSFKGSFLLGLCLGVFLLPDVGGVCDVFVAFDFHGRLSRTPGSRYYSVFLVCTKRYDGMDFLRDDLDSLHESAMSKILEI